MSILKILFLCTGNSCRSQMAEGWARHLHPDKIQAYSAGIEKHGLNERAVTVMAEGGVDISTQRSKTMEELGDQRFDYVITVCDHAHESCPLFPGTTSVVHVGFADPRVWHGRSPSMAAMSSRSWPVTAGCATRSGIGLPPCPDRCPGDRGLISPPDTCRVTEKT
ncbi:arsenate reductase (thioredoxin) [Desulfofustis glycolicus DSM 9705]|uniref:Arsenate reductase (Thioredoxin) n=1 Tax=Desulfofustis glycolicus DSM 9705 TaxID=1121409 RepID=A0A1M5T057_9BACT|nr:arsenate reductase ArsC [Desulfofustis glycolicus]SHH44161.1 arsenate reductase (thioredoxin) [Desulfofustis glycolicus DSM 9705]